MDSPPAPLETQRAQRVFFLFLFGERPKRNKPNPFGQLLSRFVFFLPGTANLLYSDGLYFMFAVLSTANIKKEFSAYSTAREGHGDAHSFMRFLRFLEAEDRTSNIENGKQKTANNLNRDAKDTNGFRHDQQARPGATPRWDAGYWKNQVWARDGQDCCLPAGSRTGNKPSPAAAQLLKVRRK
jgi:hypothetical protein